jgi:hypothetical protein
LSPIGLRLFSVVAEAILIFVPGLMARKLGGGRFAQVITARVLPVTQARSGARLLHHQLTECKTATGI